MDEILKRVDSVEKQISTVKNKVAYRDLRRMLAGVDRTVNELSRESVECRRNKKTTSRYKEIEIAANQLLDNLEQHITFAALLG
jgi:16S rRNA U516 pseudouridylate synthase RsuA-like enzyme